jgi:hypothetical protein
LLFEIGDIFFRSFRDFFVGVVENIDIVGAAWPIAVEDEASGHLERDDVWLNRLGDSQIKRFLIQA